MEIELLYHFVGKLFNVDVGMAEIYMRLWSMALIQAAILGITLNLLKKQPDKELDKSV